MGQLRSLLNRRNVTTDVTKDMNANEDFLNIIVAAHTIAAALNVLSIKSSSDIPSVLSGMHSDATAALNSLVRSISNKFIDITFSKDKPSEVDHVFEYAKETLSLGMIYLEFKDAVKEGDGTRVLRCWKYFLLFFRATGHTNYCIEAFNLLALYYCILPQRFAEQMLWGRFINTVGKRGHNISADLHMEHLNRLCKDIVNHLGAVKSPKAILRAGKALGTVHDVLNNFDSITNSKVSASHTSPSIAEDLLKAVELLIEKDVFTTQAG